MFVLCPGLCTPCEAAGHCSGAAFMSRQWDQNVQHLFGGAGSLRQGEQAPGVQKTALRSALSAAVGVALLNAEHKIRIQDWVWSTGFTIWGECVHPGERPQQPRVLSITVCTGLLLAGCFFMLQEFLFFIHSIPFYMILNSFFAIFLFL